MTLPSVAGKSASCNRWWSHCKRKSTISKQRSRPAISERVMLGQVAYRLDDLARDFVFSGKLQIAPLSIGEIRRRDERKELSPEKSARWECFKRFLAVKQWMVSDVVAVAKSLRAGRFVDAYGPEEELEKVTQSQLEEWASLHLERTHVDGVKAFIRLVAEFAVAGQVRCCATPTMRCQLCKPASRILSELEWIDFVLVWSQHE